MAEIRYLDAIRAALEDELAADDAVCLLGEDITLGGPFGATKGLVDRFGEWRIRNTPISEATVVGLAVGAALTGSRPVVEVMFVDFMTLAMDQLVNHAAKLRYMSDGALGVPLTIRAQFGAVGGMGAHHSQSLEAWFAHVPGLRVIAPSTPADAYAALRAAIRSDDPVLYLEHRGLYWQRGEQADPAAADPWRARIRRPGRDVTILAWSRMVSQALEAADRLAADGIEAEVVDLRSLSPLDLETILASVRRTRRVAVVHEAVTIGGLGAEIAASVTEAAFSDLAAPVLRLGAPFAPPPAGPELEALFVPSVDRIVDATRALALGSTPSSLGASPSPA
jgi:pyruvate/2-oxoglutarate/acetoin dehydrogenase E1 component